MDLQTAYARCMDAKARGQEARAHYYEANVVNGIRDLISAGNIGAALTAIYPILEASKGDPIQLFQLACVELRQQHFEAALPLFEEALRRRPGLVEALNNIGYVYKEKGENKKAKEAFRRALAMRAKETPHLAEARADLHNNLGAILLEEGELTEARYHVDEAVKLSPGMNNAKFNRGLIKLRLGDYDSLGDDYDRGFYTRERPVRPLGVPMWAGASNKRVVVYGEQGIGDELMHCSLLPELIAASKQVILECHPRLEALFRATFPELEIYPTRKEMAPQWPETVDMDAKVATESLMRHLRPTKASFAKQPRGYLKVRPELVEAARAMLRERFPTGPIIGIGWKGGTPKTGQKGRSMELEDISRAVPSECNIVSLQYTDYADLEADAFNARHKHGRGVFHDWAWVKDFEKMTALVAACDVILTVSTALYHQAGALGKPCICLVSRMSSWRYYPYAGQSLWYPTTTLVKQDETRWEPAIKQARAALCEFLKTT